MKLLITGANRGLGYHLATQAAAQGHTVFAGVRTEDAVVPSAERVHKVVLDVSDESSVARAARQIAKETEHLDGIINNAAVLLGRDKMIDEVDLDEVRRSFEVNTFGPLRVIKHLLPLLRKSERPVILNISSEAGSFYNAYGGDFPYALSKTALNMLSQQLRNGLKKHDITVAAVHPGWMRTDMGGPKASLDPADVAEAILHMAERKVEIDPDSVYAFVDHRGQSLPI